MDFAKIFSAIGLYSPFSDMRNYLVEEWEAGSIEIDGSEVLCFSWSFWYKTQKSISRDFKAKFDKHLWDFIQFSEVIFEGTRVLGTIGLAQEEALSDSRDMFRIYARERQDHDTFSYFIPKINVIQWQTEKVGKFIPMKVSDPVSPEWILGQFQYYGFGLMLSRLYLRIYKESSSATTGTKNSFVDCLNRYYKNSTSQFLI